MVHDQYVSSTGKIPEEAKALSLLAPATPVPSLIPGGGLLPIPTPAPLQNLNLPLVNRISSGLSPTSSVLSQPPLVGNVDPSKIDEIRRTVYVGNLNSQTTTAEQLLEFFKQVGDVKFVRMAGDETQPTRFAFVEFVDQDSVARALTFNGVMFGDRPLKVNHSNNAIVKPPELTPQAAAKELESVMKRVREAQSTIAAAIEPAEVKKRSSSRSRRSRRSRSRSHSHSRSRRKRSRSKHRPSQRSWAASDSHSSRGGRRRRSRSRDRRRIRSRSRGHKKRSKDRSRSPRRKARSPSPKRGKREKRRERSRDRKERSTSRKRSRKDEDRIKSKSKTTKLEVDYIREEKEEYGSDREDSVTLSEDMASSPFGLHNGSYRTLSEEEASLGADGTK
ncbi:splicing regulatory glutamine/lysine-rich protein 1 isoform X2 [Melanotaenia boesemani]|uniref:splicing regulatory glutamine/lysine-rich protein 1 isoform X2 n=1 Tax=Melanotaenia boesemani TaxID=1250792 RepID=UPI001C058907|nr:splicing regulatory glutamine/lysine-rich protein 1 isoform X2 [Melanotaenia boesemani]XP_041825707.1 splicing regulatory glutamine/lysine-rich protein 1 isoform X2 [Melanotaenia boesemani]XP_041825708.1 splicing regulatory glutamine/lysine-rich protein 1 isoform X2 [Melanotaenia boesemani]XP_041825709.1 splicing regulatory glutamine/lysine-rich protein 1 isoform X2 [Melanotaenia boesemani]